MLCNGDQTIGNGKKRSYKTATLVMADLSCNVTGGYAALLCIVHEETTKEQAFMVHDIVVMNQVIELDPI